jgi:hypothetical protein
LQAFEVDITDLDVDELAHAHRRIEEQLEQDLVLHVTAVLDGAEEALQIGIGKQLRQPALFASPAQAQLLAAPGHRHEPAYGGQSVGLSLELRLFQSHQAILPGSDFPSTRPHVRRRSDRRGARGD